MITIKRNMNKKFVLSLRKLYKKNKKKFQLKLIKIFWFYQ